MAAVKTFKKTDFAHFAAAAELLGISHVQLARDLGYTDSVVNRWTQEKHIPFVAGLACDGLLAAHNKERATAEPPTAYIVTCSADQVKALNIMLVALGVNFTSITVP